ncbi:MAG TPA: hypothetical protein DHV31_02980 [Clostridiales bacterium]|nr:hypothetical protein [Clostridiales bacterium]
MQKIMEPIFEIGYLLFALSAGVIFLVAYGKRRENSLLLLGLMTLLLGVGDAFHLITRMWGLLGDGLENHTFSLGLGKLITSVTMTLFYLLFYWFFVKRYEKKNTLPLTLAFLLFALARFILLALPQNGWFEADPSKLFAILRNVPFLLMGALFVCISFLWAKEDRFFKYTYLLVFFSFGFYMITVLLASRYTWAGMMMLPKTVCYVLMIVNALRYLRTLSKQ